MSCPSEVHEISWFTREKRSSPRWVKIIDVSILSCFRRSRWTIGGGNLLMGGVSGGSLRTPGPPCSSGSTTIPILVSTVASCVRCGLVYDDIQTYERAQK